MKRQPSEQSPTNRSVWQSPRVARLEAGSAENGPSNNEDGDFTAS